MPEYTMYIACAPQPSETVREDAIEELSGTVLLDDPAAPTYHTTMTAPTQEAAAAHVTAVLVAAGMVVTSIEFVPAEASAQGGAGGSSAPVCSLGPDAGPEEYRSVLTRIAHWAAQRDPIGMVTAALTPPQLRAAVAP